ncbi:XRE family transcriptional regulator [Parabacteroides pacaensis]|uniref:XRE family transcriptional regulator n=1 Tax=Parabacteroides pacaensis TaxID=2086575 RepID=UPI000D0EF482|nr:XRE family transcriptional regulator [Parabacteroides pacaensis]
METTINERIKRIIEINNYSISSFADRIGVLQQTLNNYINKNREPSFDVINKIATTFVDINIDWLVTGKGSMLKEATPALTVSDPKEKLIPLYRNEAAAGFGSADFAIKDTDIEGYYKIKEFMNADFMLHVRGDSMLPLYKPGDTIAVREIKRINFIQWGKPHLIAARYQGLLIKRLYPSNEDDVVTAISENKEIYPPFNIPKEEITGIALVIGTVRLDNF